MVLGWVTENKVGHQTIPQCPRLRLASLFWCSFCPDMLKRNSNPISVASGEEMLNNCHVMQRKYNPHSRQAHGTGGIFGIFAWLCYWMDECKRTIRVMVRRQLSMIVPREWNNGCLSRVGWGLLFFCFFLFPTAEDVPMENFLEDTHRDRFTSCGSVQECNLSLACRARC